MLQATLGKLDELIEEEVSYLAQMINEDDIEKCQRRLGQLLRYRQQIAEIANETKKKKFELSPQTLNVLIQAGTSIASILLILNYEKLSIFATKAASFIIKPKV